MTERGIQMVDLHGQYLEIQDDLHVALQEVLDETAFIRGEAVVRFERELAEYLEGNHCIGVGNGTDALQIAMMAAGIGPGDEVITTAFTFVATAEAAALLGATPVFVDIDPATFNMDPERTAAAVSSRTRAIVPVHLFGQAADMDPIVALARERDIAVIEDNAQSIGARYKGRRLGYVGDAGCLSFFPSKNLGAYGDGGAVTASDAEWAERTRMIANHGSRKKYHNEILGVNSRLDTLQAAVLRVKLKRLDEYIRRRRTAASHYDELLADIDAVVPPLRIRDGDHVFHQYTIRVRGGDRDRLADHLRSHGIPTAVYYPVPLHHLPVFHDRHRVEGSLAQTERAAEEVLSLPMHTQLTPDQQAYIAESIGAFYRIF